ncbi:hypothetical protein [Sphingomonas crocodyli]|uniref:DUF1488 family protein n=1 Tax=Sphingomonas crocodyli TaxID=1979270 RepID=A0A437LYH3_9SPHN|nr:hypothetical protein [Sphingomonas crocodyli]RVT90489.1 hypothetical protein EOD43_19765 [Sphingomonas crocodyli]
MQNVTFQFTLPDHRSLSAQIRERELVKVFGSRGDLSPDDFFNVHRRTVEAAARRKATHMTKRPRETVSLTAVDFRHCARL